MKILFISGELIGSALCQKLLKEGNEVKLYIEKKKWKNCLDGIVPKIKDWREELEWVGKDGLIIFDDVIFGKEQDYLRKEGYLVVGSSGDADQLEIDRICFKNILDKTDIQFLPSFDFTTVNEAIKFIENNPSRWVIKQNGHMSSLNFIIEEFHTLTDIIKVLKEYERRNISPIHIQKFVSGIEVGIGRYFNGRDWIGPIEVNYEHKRLLEGDFGPMTPEMGTVLYYTEKEIPLFTETLGKLKPYLKEIGFKGDIDINCIVNKDGVWPLEATPRFGTPAIGAQVELTNSPWSEFLKAIATGSDYDLDYSKDFGIVVCVTLPPFPYNQNVFQKFKNFLRRKKIAFKDDISTEDFEHIRFEEVSENKGEFYWSGEQGWVMHVTSRGKTIEEARGKVYEIINKILLPDMYYRKDIGVRVEKNDLPQLKAWGWV